MGFYWRQTYFVQLSAALMMFLAMPLQWSSEHGTGLQLLNKALDTTIAIGLNPFRPNYIPVSQWWIVWIIPALGALLGLRAINGLIFTQLEGKQYFVRVITLAMLLASGWYGAAFSPSLQIGFWIEMVAAWTLIAAVWLELWLLEFAPVFAEQHTRFVAPPDPDQVAAPSQPTPTPPSPICGQCGHVNSLIATTCQQCGAALA
jgi:hypothetical protein